MLFQQLNRTDAEKVFIICRNTSGATLAANLPVYFEVDAVTDGLAVSQMVTSGNTLFAGINDASLADDGYGLVQVYGYRASVVYCPVVSTYSAIPGTRLVGVAGAAYLAFGSALSGANTTDALQHTANDQFVIALETKASADGKSSTGNMLAFIRAL